MKKRLISTLLTLAIALIPAATASASSYNGTSIAPEADGKTHTINANSSDTVNLVNVGGENSGIQLSITFSSNVSGTVVITKSNTLPGSAASAPEGNIYTYYEVTLNGFTNDDIASGTWSFSVPKSWVSETGLSPGNIMLLHYQDGAWHSLTTHQTASSAEAYSFSAETPSFSPFAVAAAPNLTNTGSPYATVLLVAVAALAVVAGAFLLTSRKREGVSTK